MPEFRSGTGRSCSGGMVITSDTASTTMPIELGGEEIAQAGVDGPAARWQRCGRRAVPCRAGLDGCLQAHSGYSLVVLGVKTILAQ